MEGYYEESSIDISGSINCESIQFLLPTSKEEMENNYYWENYQKERAGSLEKIRQSFSYGW
jgi:hypothetical protein